ncbi:MAG: methyltransferase [Promethearchaeota archaeon]
MNDIKKKDPHPNKKMSSWGVGPKMTLYLVPFIVLIVSLDFVFGSTFLLPINQIWMVILGFILITIGFFIWSKSRKAINKAYKESKLVTTGIYGHMRHPLYASFILFLIPGVACLFNSWILFLIPIICYIIFRITIKKEENYCMEKFGEKYAHYRESVYAIFPKLKTYKPE